MRARGRGGAEYHQLVTLYRTSPDEAVSRVLQLTQSVRDAAVDEAVAATGNWWWDDLAAAAMLETDAALPPFGREDAASAPHLDAAERLL